MPPFLRASVPIVLFAGGGTGGHLMPALAIADAMVAADSRIEPLFVGAERGIEAQVLPARPWRYSLLPFEPIYRRQWWKNVRLPWSMWRSMRGVREVHNVATVSGTSSAERCKHEREANSGQSLANQGQWR